MEAGVGNTARSSFRKPSHATSQRNYRRRSPSSSSSSRSPSPSPPAAGTGASGWKRDRSASPSSPKRGDDRNLSLHSKKGKTARDGSEEETPGRFGEASGPDGFDRHRRGGSYDRHHARPDAYDSRRGSASHRDRYHEPYGRRDAYGDAQRNGDYDRSSRGWQSPDRGYRDDFRGRERERFRSRRGERDRDFERHGKYRTGGREGNFERRDMDIEGKVDLDGRDRYRDRERDRYRERERDRDGDWNRGRSRGGRSEGRTSYSEKYDDGERKYERGKSRDGNRDADRERGRSRHSVREHSAGRDYEAGEFHDERSREGSRERERGSDREKRQTRSGERNLDDSKYVDREQREWSSEGGRDAFRGKPEDKVGTSEYNGAVDIEARLDGGAKVRDRSRADEKRHGDVSSPEMEREKPADRTVCGSRGGDGEPVKAEDKFQYSDDLRDRRRQRDVDDGSRATDYLRKERSKERERSSHRDKEDNRGRDRPREKASVSVKEHDRSGSRSDIGKLESKVVGGHRERDKGKSSGSMKGSGSDRQSSDVTRDEDKAAVKSDRAAASKGRSEIVNEGSSSDMEGSKDRNFVKGAEDSASLKSDLDTKPTAGSDVKASKGSKWGPQASGSTLKSPSRDEVANDLNAAKLAAMKAAELVNKNLGVAGFMSADQKKRLLWGSKKLSAEQEPAATGSNRWDTVQFSDRDRQEKFNKLMGVKAETCTESKKEDVEIGTFTEERQRELQQDLEKQFAAGLRRRDGGKVGLGM